MVFANFAYYDRQAWYLTGDGGLSGWKKYFGQIWAKIGQILALKEVFGHFLEIASLLFANIAYDDKQVWYLTGDGGLSGWKKYFGLKSSLFRVMTTSICVKQPYIMLLRAKGHWNDLILYMIPLSGFLLTDWLTDWLWLFLFPSVSCSLSSFVLSLAGPLPACLLLLRDWGYFK